MNRKAEIEEEVSKLDVDIAALQGQRAKLLRELDSLPSPVEGVAASSAIDAYLQAQLPKKTPTPPEETATEAPKPADKKTATPAK